MYRALKDVDHGAKVDQPCYPSSGTSEQVQKVRGGGREIASGKEKRADGASQVEGEDPRGPRYRPLNLDQNMQSLFTR